MRAIQPIILMVIVLNSYSLSASPKDTPQSLATVNIQIEGAQATVEVADTEATREKGLMFRDKLPPDHGMLFVFESEQPLSFWMKNTWIPLSIAFIDREFRVIDTQEMKPPLSVMDLKVETYVSKRPALLALEMNPGWFSKHKINEGARLKIKEPIRSSLLRRLYERSSRQ